MFRIAADTDTRGFLAFVNSPGCMVAFIAILVLGTVLSGKIGGVSTNKSLKAWAPLAQNNMRLNTFAPIWGDDVAIFDLRKIILKEMKKMTISPPFMKNVENVTAMRNIWRCSL